MESMLDALGHGHVEAVAWLVNEWRESSGMFDERHMKRGRGHWQPERAQRILDGLAATEDQDCAEEILRRARGHEPWRGRHPFREEWESSEEMEQKMAEDLFAPLFWRLPVEAVVKSMDRRYPGDTGPLVGYRLLAHHLMGLRYDPERSALEEARALADRLPGSDDHGDEGDERILRWLHRSAWERSKRVHFSEEPPPALLWEEMLREESYWRRELEEAGLKAREKVKKLLESRGSLRRRLKEIAARRELVMQGLLCDYEASGRIELYPQVISAAAEVLGISPRHLKSVVFIHVCTWAMASEAFDLDGQRGYGFIPPPRTGPVARESPTNVALVQAFTDRLIRTLRDANLEAASEELSKHQPPAYTRWAELGKLPLEKLRQLLLAARASAAALDLPSGDTQ